MVFATRISTPVSPASRKSGVFSDGSNCSPRGSGNGSRVGCTSRQQSLPASCSSRGPNDSGAARVFVVSDLHTDYRENMEWVRRLSTTWYRNDVLIVAGDVAETHKNFVATMAELKSRFDSVFFVPGNHDLWCRREGGRYMNSLEKLSALFNACSDLGVDTSPRIIDGLGIIPLLSWYHKSFDREKDITDVRIPSLEMACKDFRACKWPQQLSSSDVSLSHCFDFMNEKHRSLVEEMQRNCSQLITFSHFLPRQELCPEKRMLFYPNLPKVMGSDSLEVRIRSIHSDDGIRVPCHVFGHTHFCWDSTLAGIRYVQAPLGYPRERKRNMNGGEEWLPFCIYHKEFTYELSPSFWSDYYAKNERTPDNTHLAPWVAKFYKR